METYHSSPSHYLRRNGARFPSDTWGQFTRIRTTKLSFHLLLNIPQWILGLTLYRGYKRQMASYLVKYTSVCVVVIVLTFIICVTQYKSLDPVIGPISASLGAQRDVYVNSFRLERGCIVINGKYRDNQSYVSTVLNLTGLTAFVDEIKPFIFTDPKFERPVLPAAKHFKINRNVPGISCRKLIQGDPIELELALNLTRFQPMPTNISLKEYMTLAANCTRFTEKRGYIMSSLTQVEEEFPIAFSLLMFKDVEQSERLLRAIYRPQNHYCIHVDKKSDVEVFNAMKAISDCFQNVFLTSERIDVQWGTMSVLEPERRGHS